MGFIGFVFLLLRLVAGIFLATVAYGGPWVVTVIVGGLSLFVFYELFVDLRALYKEWRG